MNAQEHQLRMMAQDASLLGYLDYRHRTGCLLRQVPDEIVAEKRMKHDYYEQWAAREDSYLRMRQRREAEIVAGRTNDNLWPFTVFYELLRIQLFISLAEAPAVQAELRRLENVTDTQLRAVTAPDTLDILLREQAALLDVNLNEPLTTAEAAHDRIFDRVMAVQQNDNTALN